jgi:hypothetical protein
MIPMDDKMEVDAHVIDVTPFRCIDLAPLCSEVVQAYRKHESSIRLRSDDHLPAMALFLRAREGVDTGSSVVSTRTSNGFQRIRRCNAALEAMDRQGPYPKP